MKNTIKYILIFLLIPLQLFPQGQEKKSYAEVIKEGTKNIVDTKDAFRVFVGEIFERQPTNLTTNLPNGKKIYLGNSDEDMKKADKQNILSKKLLQDIIKKQKVFLGDGKLYDGYLVDFNHEEFKDISGNIIVANYLLAKITFGQDTQEFKDNYPYDTSGLVYFYKSSEKFLDPYIRIIVPGYVTAFIDKDSIESISQTYDKKVFDEYNLLINKSPKLVLVHKETKKAYQLNPSSFEDSKILPDGTYQINGEKKELTLSNGTIAKKDIKKSEEPFDILLIIIATSVVIALLLFWFFRKNIRNLFKKDDSKDGDGENHNPSWENTDEDSIEESKDDSNITSDKSFKGVKKFFNEKLIKVKEEINKQLAENNKNITEQIKQLNDKLENSNNEEFLSLKKKKEDLSKEMDRLEIEKKSLTSIVNNLRSDIKYKDQELSTSKEKLHRFEVQALFIDNYEKLTNKLIPFFDTIKQLEYKLISDINSQANYTIKQFQALVLSKYLYHKITDDFKDWDTILRTLQTNNGLITDKTILLQIKDKTSTHEQLQGIEWIVVNDVIVPKVDRLLILLEEFRNTLKITGVETELSSTKIEQNKIGIIEKMKSLFDIQIENIELFSDSSSYNLEFSQDNPSYEINMKNLKIGAIKEIKTYGMKLKEKTIKTKVIE